MENKEIGSYEIENSVLSMNKPPPHLNYISFYSFD